MKNIVFILLVVGFFSVGCQQKVKRQKNGTTNKISVIFDTDANNELDDQHALAYLLFSGKSFKVKGVTVNATYNGGAIGEHFNEANRVMQLCKLDDKIPLIRGANGNFDSIQKNLNKDDFDGSRAVNFIIEEAKAHIKEKLVIIAVGKLTNVALALKKEPSIKNNIRLVWLGSNYPEPGEYNLENDISAMNFLLNSDIHFEMVTVRYGRSSGTDAVKVFKGEPSVKLSGLGPHTLNHVEGRHGGKFNNFGDYAVSLFNHGHYYGDPPARSLFDMAAVAIIKNPNWAESSLISSPIMIDEKWVEQPENNRKIIIWENFEVEKILFDFYFTLKNYELVN